MLALAWLQTLRLLRAPRGRTALVWGAIFGLAFLARTDSALVLGGLGVYAAWRLRKSPQLIVVGAIAALIVVAPWFLWNYCQFRLGARSSQQQRGSLDGARPSRRRSARSRRGSRRGCACSLTQPTGCAAIISARRRWSASSSGFSALGGFSARFAAPATRRANWDGSSSCCWSAGQSAAVRPHLHPLVSAPVVLHDHRAELGAGARLVLGCRCRALASASPRSPSGSPACCRRR